MNKYLKCTIFVFIFLLFLLIVLYVSISPIKYSLYDCVTYFDKEARYQLIYVGDNYYLFDAQIERSIATNIRYYLYKDDRVYLIYDKYLGEEKDVSKYEKMYGIFKVSTGDFTTGKSLDNFEESFLSIEEMIELPLSKTDFERWISDFIPKKFVKSS